MACNGFGILRKQGGRALRPGVTDIGPESPMFAGSRSHFGSVFRSLEAGKVTSLYGPKHSPWGK